jgi:hypothetical protein
VPRRDRCSELLEDAVHGLRNLFGRVPRQVLNQRFRIELASRLVRPLRMAFGGLNDLLRERPFWRPEYRRALSRFVTSSAPSSRSALRFRSIVTSRADIRRIKTRGLRTLRAPRNSPPPAPRTEHARNQVGTSSADAATTCGGENVGRRSEGRGPEAARPPIDAARHTTEDRPTVSGAGHHPGGAGAAVTSLPPAVERAPAGHRPGVGRSLSSHPFLDPAGSRSLHRRGRRAAPRPRRHARARDPTGPGGESPARPPWEGGRRSVSRPPADDAAADAYEHGLRAAQLPEAPACARVHRSTELRPPLFGMAARTGAHGARAGHSHAVHLDGARRLAARRRALAGGRAAGGISATAPHLIRRRLRQPFLERSPWLLSFDRNQDLTTGGGVLQLDCRPK